MKEDSEMSINEKSKFMQGLEDPELTERILSNETFVNERRTESKDIATSKINSLVSNGNSLINELQTRE